MGCAAGLGTDKTFFICLGAQKAGTTWLHDQLSARPDFHAPLKEVHYFDMVAIDAAQDDHLKAEREGFFRRRLEIIAAATAALASADRGGRKARIAHLFNAVSVLEMSEEDRGEDSRYLHFMTRDAGSKRVIGDVTPAYAVVSRKVFARMAALAPNVRFLFLLRDPIDRLWSQVRMRMNRAAWADEAAFEQASLDDLKKMMGAGPLTGPHRSNYRHTFGELDAAVPRENLMVMFYETMFSQVAMERLCRFIGIAPFVAEADRKVLAGRDLAMPADLVAQCYLWLKDQYDYVAQRFGDALPERWRQRMALASL
jgi:hypothetical protein